MCAQCMVHLCEAVLVILSYAYTYVHAHIDIFETPRNPPMLSHCTTAWIKCWWYGLYHTLKHCVNIKLTQICIITAYHHTAACTNIYTQDDAHCIVVHKHFQWQYPFSLHRQHYRDVWYTSLLYLLMNWKWSMPDMSWWPCWMSDSNTSQLRLTAQAHIFALRTDFRVWAGDSQRAMRNVCTYKSKHQALKRQRWSAINQTYPGWWSWIIYLDVRLPTPLWRRFLEHC